LGLDAAAAAVAAQATLGRHHAMAGNDDRQRIAATRLADVLRRGVERASELAIAAGLAVRDGRHEAPYLLLERRAGWRQRQIERAQLAAKISIELTLRLEQQRRLVGCGMLAAPIDRGQTTVFLAEREAAQWAIDRETRHRGIPYKRKLRASPAQAGVQGRRHSVGPWSLLSPGPRKHKWVASAGAPDQPRALRHR